MKKLIYTLALSLAFASCEEPIDIEIPNGANQMVVEGNIDINDIARVTLSKSLGYFDPLDLNALSDLFITDAVVTLSDGNQTENLTLFIDENVFPPIFYQSSNIKGEINKSYTLNISWDNKEYSAKTHIVNPAPLDSVWFELEDGEDSLGIIKFLYVDPDTIGNRFRVFTKRVGRDSYFVPSPLDLRYDIIVNGETFESFVYRGQSLEDPESDPERFYYKLGDTLILRWSSIDYDHFEFWRTLANNEGGNPFAAPVNVKSNIENGLGIWGGYASIYDTIVAKIE
ncbi:MAG: hypothetical protein ACI8P7_000442 [Candidatus Azotimanducaceae bacterium]|jgi:hypothetical protein